MNALSTASFYTFRDRGPSLLGLSRGDLNQSTVVTEIDCRVVSRDTLCLPAPLLYSYGTISYFTAHEQAQTVDLSQAAVIRRPVSHYTIELSDR